MNVGERSGEDLDQIAVSLEDGQFRVIKIVPA